MSRPHLHVDLSRIRANLATLHERIAPSAVMVVVKDDAYRHGVEKVVGTAAAVGVSWFGSFDVATGLRVRAVAPGARIFAWATSDRDEIRDAADAGIELGVGDPDHLEKVAAAGRGIPIHLKIDTGLHRNGVRPEGWEAFVARAVELERRGAVRVAGIWSHIAEASDDEDDDARALFTSAVGTARGAGLRPDVLHLAASAAGFARDEFRHDVVRVGAFVYGVRSTDAPDVPGILPAAALLAPVTAVRGDAVELGIGALDGLPSILAGRMAVGTPAGPRTVRDIGAATSTVDGWPGAGVGDEAVVFGPGTRGEESATTLAESIGTVGEELLVRLAPRIERTYSP